MNHKPELIEDATLVNENNILQVYAYGSCIIN